MSETPPPNQPSPSGQIEAPNPIELFWEKNRRVVITIVTAGVFALGLNYVLQYKKQAEIDALWGTFATAANLDKQYASPELPEFAALLPQGLTIHQLYQIWTPELITELARHVGEADARALTEAIAESAGTPGEPYLIWVAAQRAMENREWDGAVGYLKDLQARFPDHDLCAATEYPVQYRPPVKAENGEEDPPGPDSPELEPPIPGSQVEAALARIERQQEFARKEARFYEPLDPPEGSPRVRVTTNWGTFTIALYEERAPEHVETFLRLVREGFYDGQNVDQIVRRPSPQSPGPEVQEFHFGLPTSRNQDRTTWDSTGPGKEILDFVDSPQQRELSHFPGTMSASHEADGKSSGERYWISVNDTATVNDGNRVIVGRVVDGMGVLEVIAAGRFATDAEAQAGQGTPGDNTHIEKIERL